MSLETSPSFSASVTEWSRPFSRRMSCRAAFSGQLPGRALVVHFAADDFGKHPTVGTSSTTGNAGPRYACRVIVASARAT